MSLTPVTSHANAALRAGSGFSQPKVRGIFLNGGGARGSYQAGFLKRMAERSPTPGRLPFEVITGVSVGALNSMALAAYADDFGKATEQGATLWHDISYEKVFVTGAWPMFKKSLALGTDFAVRLSRIDMLMRSLGVKLGGSVGQHSSVFQSLLDFSPLRRFIDKNVDFDRVRWNIEEGNIRAVAVTTFNYSTGKSTTFFDGDPSIPNWERRGHVGIRTRLNADHVLASCALPLFFPPVVISGDEHCDGGKELKSPLSPAIHLGADHVLAINNSMPGQPDGRPDTRLGFGAIVASLIGSAFADHVIHHGEQIAAINRGLPEGFRPIGVSMVTPSTDLYLEALAVADKALPWTMRFLLGPWGGPQALGNTLSTFMFHPQHCRKLFQVGYRDGDQPQEHLAAPTPLSSIVLE